MNEPVNGPILVAAATCVARFCSPQINPEGKGVGHAGPLSVKITRKRGWEARCMWLQILHEK